MLGMTMRSAPAGPKVGGRVRDKQLQHLEFASRRPDCCASAPANRRPSVPLFAAEQPELRRIARRLGEAEVAEGMGSEQAPARGALDEAFLDQERLDDLFHGVARLGKGGGEGLCPHRSAARVLAWSRPPA